MVVFFVVVENFGLEAEFLDFTSQGQPPTFDIHVLVDIFWIEFFPQTITHAEMALLSG